MMRAVKLLLNNATETVTILLAPEIADTLKHGGRLLLPIVIKGGLREWPREVAYIDAEVDLRR